MASAGGFAAVPCGVAGAWNEVMTSVAAQTAARSQRRGIVGLSLLRVACVPNARLRDGSFIDLGVRLLCFGSDNCNIVYRALIRRTRSLVPCSILRDVPWPV